MMRVLILPLASPIHPSESYLDTHENIICTYKNELTVHEVVTKFGDFTEDVSKYDIILVVVLTGGVSDLGFQILKGFKGNIIIISYSLYNSLASSISLRLRLSSLGLSPLLLHGSSKDELQNLLKITCDIIKSIEQISKFNIGIIGEGPPVDKYINKFGGHIIKISVERVKELWVRDVEKYRRLFNKAYISDYNALIRALEVYATFKKLVENYGLNVIAVDCFHFIKYFHVTPCIAFSILNSEGIIGVCEADLTIIPLMTLSYRFTGISGWIANVYDIGPNRVKFSHCTIAMNITRNIDLLPHFESGYPLAIKGDLSIGYYTAVSISKDFNKIFIGRGKLYPSTPSKHTCRTQHIMIIKKIRGVDDLINNHHLITKVDPVIYKIFAYLSDLEYQS